MARKKHLIEEELDVKRGSPLDLYLRERDRRLSPWGPVRFWLFALLGAWWVLSTLRGL